MSENSSDLQARIVELEARVSELEALQQLVLRILSTSKPLDSVLEQYGATDTQAKALYKLLDDLVARARGREQDRPTFAYFQMQLGNIFPSLRQDREFMCLVLDTLKIERAAYRELSTYCVARGWSDPAHQPDVRK
jgi:hypothetical protein